MLWIVLILAAVMVGLASAMRPEDVLLPSYRETGAQIWRSFMTEALQAVVVPLAGTGAFMRVLAAVAGYPLLRTIYLSFTEYNILQDPAPRWIGLGNYERLFTDSLQSPSSSRSRARAIARA